MPVIEAKSDEQVLLEDPTALPEGPPPEEFWERFNSRLEFPLATVGAILLHVLVATFLVLFFLGVLDRKKDTGGVPVSLVRDMGGDDDTGEGSAGSGGVEDPLKQERASSLEEQLKILPDPSKLPTIKDDLRQAIQFDEGNIPISDVNAAAYSALDKSLTEKLLGAKKGAGPGAGTGDDGSKGTGPGGKGADSTRARSLRWVMRFSTNGGDDYLAQLRAMKAKILVPIPPGNKQCHFFKDLSNPGNRTTVNDDQLGELSGLIRFCDTRPDSVESICRELGVKDRATVFFAFFPKDMEEILSRKETGYRNRRAEDIEETKFRVIVKGNGFDLVVDDQKLKR